MSDSDWAVRCSTSGSIVQWHNVCIDWGSSQQTSLSLSSCEAEVMAGSETTKSVLYFRNLLEGIIGFPQTSPTPVRVDNIVVDGVNPQQSRYQSRMHRLGSASQKVEAHSPT